MAGGKVRVLGRLEVVASDGVVVPLAAKQRRLLAALVAADGRARAANVARSLFNLGAVALKLGRLQAADERFRASLACAQEVGDTEDVA